MYNIYAVELAMAMNMEEGLTRPHEINYDNVGERRCARKLL